MHEKISVIIPVFNGAPFLAEAVNSAILQPETAEVILIDDASTDASWQVMQELSNLHSLIRIFQLPHNKGAAAARNLGLQHAREAWISFLDADDYFLPGRFGPFGQLLLRHPDLDGGYDFILHQFDHDAPSEVLLTNTGEQHLDIRTFHSIAPEHLFEELLFRPGFWIPMVGFTVKKSFLEREGIRFDESLRYTEDTDFIYRCVLRGQFRSSGANTPLITRRIHSGNSVFAPAEKWQVQRAAFFDKWLKEVRRQSLGTAVNRYFIKSWIHHRPALAPFLSKPLLRLPVKAFFFICLMLRYPKLLSRWHFFK